MRWFAKPVRGFEPLHGFESRPLRHLQEPGCPSRNAFQTIEAVFIALNKLRAQFKSSFPVIGVTGFYPLIYLHAFVGQSHGLVLLLNMIEFIAGQSAFLRFDFKTS